MKTVYYTNGKLDDEAGTGVTVASYLVNDEGVIQNTMLDADGKQFLGYMPNEVSEKEYLQWKERIAKPDGKKYFAGIFPSIGVVDKATRKALDENQAKAKQAYCEKQCEANRINFKLAQRDAEAIGEDHEAVFTSKHTNVSEDVKAMLFADARAAKKVK